MKIQVSDLRPNPFRRLEKYPIRKSKKESLKRSINQTGFWDNVLTRKRGDKYEIAYGHHRLVALKELGIKEVNLPVKDISDANMIRIMANENMEDWKLTPLVINETISVAKDFLDGELAKYENWEEVPPGLLDSIDLKNRSAFQNIKTKGAGTPTICKFLGENWMPHRIQEALRELSMPTRVQLRNNPYTDIFRE